MRRFKSTILLEAKRGGLQELQHLVDGIHTLNESLIPDVFEAFFEHLEASKVPSVETLPTSFERNRNRFKDRVVERALLSVRCLGRAAVFKDLVRSDALIRGVLKLRWPGVLAWLCYFYVGCFERNLVDVAFKDNMAQWLNLAFVLPTHGDELVIAIGAVPGTIGLATLLCTLENKGSYVDKDNLHLGTATLMYFLQIGGNSHALDEVVEALNGSATAIVEVAIMRLQKAVNSLELAFDSAMMHLSLLMTLASVPKQHSLWLTLHRKSLIAIVTNVLLRLIDIPFNQGSYSPDSTVNIQYCISMCISNVDSLIMKNTIATKPALQALEAGLLTALANCAPLAFSFKVADRKAIICILQHLTQLSAHIAVARQASAELEKLENTLSVQGRINGSTPDVRDAWKVFYETILARRVILAQMQELNSTPMSCDNCYKFDERANFKKCAGCGRAHYCSRDCQTRAWKEKGHRDECKTLKAKPVKTKHRAINQEKYFLARIAINDAQLKKEQLKLMASVGLEYVGVEVFYNSVPPRFMVSCDLVEITAQHEQVLAMMKEVGDSLFLDAIGLKDYTKKPRSASSLSGAREEHGDQTGETIRIQLNDKTDEQTSLNSNVPPVHLRVHVLQGDRVRDEHFVVDDFWDFVQIKFDDLVLDSDEAQLGSGDAMGANRYEADHFKRYSPEVQRMMKEQRLFDSERRLAEQSVDDRLKNCEDKIMAQVKDLWQSKKLYRQHLRLCQQLSLKLAASRPTETSDESQEPASPAL